MGMDVVIVAALPVADCPPRLTDYHQVDEHLEPTLVMDEPPDYAAFWERVERLERPTIPIGYHRLPVDKLEEVLAKLRR